MRMGVLGESREGVSQGPELPGWGSFAMDILRNCSPGLRAPGKGRQKEMRFHGWAPRGMGMPRMGSGWVGPWVTASSLDASDFGVT